jgi:hypothetical protein
MMGILFLVLSMTLNLTTGVTYALTGIEPTVTVAPVNTAPPVDTVAPVDTVPPVDTVLPVDTVPPVDTVAPVDTVPPVDTVAPVDTVTPVDTATQAAINTVVITPIPSITVTKLPGLTGTPTSRMTSTPVVITDPFLGLMVSCLDDETARFTIINLGGSMQAQGSYSIDEPGIGITQHTLQLGPMPSQVSFNAVGNATVNVRYSTSTLSAVFLSATGHCMLQPTNTPVPTSTQTLTPLPTGTPTLTATPTPTNRVTRTPTHTPVLPNGPTNTPRSTHRATNTPRSTNGPVHTPMSTNGPTNNPGFTRTATLVPSVLTLTLNSPLTPSRTPTSALLAPNIVGPTSTLGTPSGQPQVLIPVTGSDLSEKQSQREIFVSRVHQLQSGMNLLGLGMIVVGLTLMRGKKED